MVMQTHGYVFARFCDRGVAARDHSFQNSYDNGRLDRFLLEVSDGQFH